MFEDTINFDENDPVQGMPSASAFDPVFVPSKDGEESEFQKRADGSSSSQKQKESYHQGLKTHVAKKVRIYDISSGKFFAGSRETYEASYVVTPFGDKVVRANVIGTITDSFANEEGTYSSVTIDDGTAAIRIKAFGKDVCLFGGLSKGDLVVVIGKVKEYQGEIYLGAEILRPIPPTESDYESLRRLEILDKINDQRRIADNIRRMRQQLSDEELLQFAKKFGVDKESLDVIMKGGDTDFSPKILELISGLDEGAGVEMFRIFELTELSEAVVERAVDMLLEEGSLFEPSPGRFKAIKDIKS
jgi:RPA family protein